MNRYNVKFEFLADKRDFGIVQAVSKDAAERLMLKKHFPVDRGDWDFLQGCMSTKLIKG